MTLETGARRISPSAIGSAARCGWAWEYHYKYDLDPPKESVLAFLGTVSHRAHEKWALDHSLDMVQLIEQAWLEEFVDEPAMHRLVVQFQKLCESGLAVMAEIQERRPEIKVVVMTKDWKESKVGKAINNFEYANKAVLARDKRDWERNSFCDGYMQSIKIAKAYQEKYRDSPEAMLTELRYEIEHNGMLLHGVIDELNLLVNDEGEVLGYLVSDYKTYQKDPEPIKDFIQLCHYTVATKQWLPFWCEQVGVSFREDWPIYSAVDLGALLDRKVYLFNDEQLALGMSLTKQYEVLREQPMLPNFKGDCSWCEWKGECNRRVGMIPIEVNA